MSERSYRLANEKIKRDIEIIISQVDAHNAGKLSFDMIGRLFQTMGIFQICYNDKRNITNTKKHCNNNKLFQAKAEKEKLFHENLWKILRYSDYIYTTVLKEVLSILYDSHYTSPSVLSEKLNSTILSYPRSFK